VINKFKHALADPKWALRKIKYRLLLKQNNLPDLVFQMALTGAMTDQCYNKGALPMLVHFYSPIPDISDLQTRNIFSKKSKMNGIDFRELEQLDLLHELGSKYGQECDWPIEPTSNEEEFYLKNSSFSFGCASALHTMIRNFKPKNIIEIGSGYSSRVISGALDLNINEGHDCNYLIIDPYPNEIIKNKLKHVSEITDKRVELVSPAIFDCLGENDILFIDSGHTVRTGSDVNFLILDIIPLLAKGVIIHFHDICLPYEYPEIYFTNAAFRMFWTEAYLLQSFLAFNNSFEVLLAMNYLQTDHMDKFEQAFQKSKSNFLKSGSFWIKKTQ